MLRLSQSPKSISMTVLQMHKNQPAPEPADWTEMIDQAANPDMPF